MRRTLLTYGELGQAIGLDGVALHTEMRHVLDDLSTDCFDRGEPSLAALVVRKSQGNPGQGWHNGKRTWLQEVRAVYSKWPPV